MDVQGRDTQRAAQRPELVQFSTAWSWPEADMDRMKSLLLYFDGVAWLLPGALRDELLDADPILAAPLYEAGLLRNYEPDQWLTAAVAADIRAAARAVAADGRLNSALGTLFSLDHMSHLIARDEDPVAQAIVEELERADVIRRRTDDEHMVLVVDFVRQVVLTVLSLAARACIAEADIQPTAHCLWPHEETQSDFYLSLGLALRALGAHDIRFTLPIKARHDDYLRLVGNPITLLLDADVQDVGVDLSGVPLDEVLAFRHEHGALFRVYQQHLRRFAVDYAAAADEEQRRLASERAEEIRDHAAALRSVRRSLGRPVAGLAFAVAGAVWTLRSGDPLGAILAGLSAVGSAAFPQNPDSPYAYLFLTQQRLR